MIRPGEIYMADFGPAGPHPVIVTSRETLNRGHYALVVPCTSSRFAVRSTLANCVPFHAGEFGFTADCVAEASNRVPGRRFPSMNLLRPRSRTFGAGL